MTKIETKQNYFSENIKQTEVANITKNVIIFRLSGWKMLWIYLSWWCHRHFCHVWKMFSLSWKCRGIRKRKFSVIVRKWYVSGGFYILTSLCHDDWSGWVRCCESSFKSLGCMYCIFYCFFWKRGRVEEKNRKMRSGTGKLGVTTRYIMTQ